MDLVYEELLNKLNEIIIIFNKKEKKIIYTNKKFEKFFGKKSEELEKKKPFCSLFLEKEGYITGYSSNGIYWIDYILTKPTISHKALLKDKDDFLFHFNIYLKKISEPDLFMVTFSNITDIISIQEELNIEKILLKEYKKIVDISTIVSKTDLKGKITYVNEKFCEISGYSRDELIGKSHSIVKHEDSKEETFRELWRTIRKGGIWTGIIKNKNKKGVPYFVDATIAPIMDGEGNIREFIGIRKDVTEEALLKEDIKRQNEELKRLTTIDSLTDSYNRRGLDDILKSEIIKHIENKTNNLSIIMCDIDRFKQVNDTYGHNNGDYVLAEFVNLLKKNLKNKDTISRYGGEEFIIVLPETDKKDGVLLAEYLRKKVEEFDFNNIGKITTSFGVASLNELNKLSSIEYDKQKEGYLDAIITKLTKKADNRLYEAKKQGRNKVISD
jgi:diguanylate cyclase (GGDEF)-like protein/PAS domain S-box-containing protein